MYINMKLHCCLSALAFAVFLHDPLKVFPSLKLSAVTQNWWRLMRTANERIVVWLKLAQFKEKGTLPLIGLSWAKLGKNYFRWLSYYMQNILKTMFFKISITVAAQSNFYFHGSWSLAKQWQNRLSFMISSWFLSSQILSYKPINNIC